MTLRLFTLAVCTAIGLSGLIAHADQAQRPTAANATAPAPAADPVPGVSFPNIHPATLAERAYALAVLESNPAVFYVGTATGGLWKTTNNSTSYVVPLFVVFHKPPDNGTTWEVLF